MIDMKIVCISDYAIHHRIGRSEPTGTTYTTRFGNTRHKNVFKEFYQTNIGEFTPEKWLEVTLQIIQTLMENELLEEIKEHVVGHCVWLKNDKEIEEYSASCLASGAYMYWEDFKDKRLPAHKVFIFEEVISDGSLYGMRKKIEKPTKQGSRIRTGML